MADNFDWNDAALTKLRNLGAHGMSARLIAVELRTSKNAVVGKAHRLNLPARPSPISGAPRNPDAPRKPIGPRASAENARMVAAFFENPGVVITEKPAVVTVAARMPGAFKPCAFPIGDPKRPSFHFCGAAALVNRPYCEEHAAISYVYVRDRREAAA